MTGDRGLQDIKNHFDKDFVSYLNTDLTRYASKFDSSAEATDWSFCPEDKPYLLDIIDRTQDKADREDAASFQEVCIAETCGSFGQTSCLKFFM